MKKVLHLFPAYKIGGAPVNVLRFIKGSRDKVFNYAAAYKIDDQLFAEYINETEESFDVDLTSFKLKSFVKLLRIVRKINPDIIHANGKGGGLYAFLLFIFYRKKIFYTFRGFHIKYIGIKHKFHIYFEKIFSLFYVKAVAVSPSEKDFYLKITGVKAEKVEVIGNGVEITQSSLPRNIQMEVDRYRINIVSLSRIDEVKDIITMVKSFDLLKNTEAALHIMGGFLTGDESYKNEVDNVIKTLSSKDQIYLWGDIQGAGNYVNNFDIYLSTSLSEGLPTSIIESGLSKVPVVASDCNGNIDLIKDGQTGYLFLKKDIGGLVEKLSLCINQLGSKEQLEILENNLNQMNTYSINSHVSKLIKLYSKKD